MFPTGLVRPMPDRVVTLMTRLVLSPYSAGGAPSITSRDCTAFEGNWLEKTLLCWSVMGWPSTEKELEAWSPSPWKSPFESAETPGDANVTSELRDDDALSNGNLSNKPRSTSVCAVGSFSIRSEAPSTVTEVDAAPTFMWILGVTGNTELTSTSVATEAKPSFVTV